MKRSSRIPTLFLALALASVAAIGAWSLTSDSEPESIGAVDVPTPTPVPTTDVVVAIADIASATLITREMVEVRQVPLELKNTHAVSEIDLVIGQLSTVSVVTGEQILDTRLSATSAALNTETFSYTVPVGKRAISLVFDEVIGSGALVQPGDYVDVLGSWIIDPNNSLGAADASEEEDGSQPAEDISPTPQPDFFVTGFVVQNVEVLAVSQAISPDEVGIGQTTAAPTATTEAGTDISEPVARPDAISVTLAVSPEEAQRLLLATQTVMKEWNAQGSSLRLVVRAPGDTTTTSLRPAQTGNLPIEATLGDINVSMAPEALVITEAEFTERIISSGTVLEFRATVKNVSDETITSSAEAPPEYEYTQGIPYDSLGFFGEEGTYRIGLNVSGAFPTQFPYRWSFGGELAPGESVVVVGSVILTEPTSGTRYWLGVIQEPNLVTQDGVAVSDITVLASESAIVRSRTANLMKSPASTAEIVLEFERGAALEILDVRGPWFLVRSGSQEGWILASSLRIDDRAQTDDTPAEPAAEDVAGT